jgi:mono/diheme cytochrome c family protein
VKKYLFIATICLGTASVQANDTTTAEKLHAENCLSCHKPDLYTRAEAKVTSREQLSTQVRMRVTQLQLPWFDEETEEMAEYLNTEFYKFK